MQPLPLKARTITLVLDPAGLAGYEVPQSKKIPQIPVTIELAGRPVMGSFNAKSLRRAITNIAALGVENCNVIVRARLSGEGQQLVDAGIFAEPKQARLKDLLAVPKRCPHCNEPVRVRNNGVIEPAEAAAA